jgi:hypothetical protein
MRTYITFECKIDVLFLNVKILFYFINLNPIIPIIPMNPLYAKIIKYLDKKPMN